MIHRIQDVLGQILRVLETALPASIFTTIPGSDTADHNLASNLPRYRVRICILTLKAGATRDKPARNSLSAVLLNAQTCAILLRVDERIGILINDLVEEIDWSRNKR
jgi:hypothetical protein